MKKTIFTERTGELEFIFIREDPELAPYAAEWFHSCWGIPVSAYSESMKECMAGKNAVPQWYVVRDGGRIIAGLGVIENDFHNRRDLAPNICAVFVDTEYRCQGIAGKMLDLVCKDMSSMGIHTLYLLTDHTSFYERYGWKYLCSAIGMNESNPSRVYVMNTK